MLTRSFSYSRAATIVVAALSCVIITRAQDPAPQTPYQVLDARSGVALPCVGCQILTYVAGTTTPVFTYTDYTLGTPNTNPVLTNSAGYAVNGSAITGIWLSASQCYKFVLEDANNQTIWTQDHICNTGYNALIAFEASLAASGGSNLIGYKESGSATTRTVQSRLRDYVTVADFAADNTGVTDAAAAINTATASLSPNGGTVYIPSGTYKINSATVSVPPKVCLLGSGAGSTILNGTGAFPVVTILNAANSCLLNLTIQSVNEDLSIANTDASLPTEYDLVQNVNMSSRGSSNAAVHVTATDCCVYYPVFDNVNISNNGVTGTGSDYLFDGTPSFNVKPIISGGRAADAKYGLNVISAERLMMSGTEFDDILGAEQVVSNCTAVDPMVCTAATAPATGATISFYGFGWPVIAGPYTATQITSTTFSVASVWTPACYSQGTITVCTVPVAPVTGATVTLAGMTDDWSALNGSQTATQISSTVFSVAVDSSSFSPAFPGTSGVPTVSIPLDSSSFSPAFPGTCTDGPCDPVVADSGIAIWLQAGVTNALLSPLRLEGDGVFAPIDKDAQFDAGTNGNQIFLDLGYGGVPSRVTDAGVNNCVAGGNSSGGLIPYCIIPQITGSITVASGSKLAVPGSTSDEFTVGTPLTMDQTLVGAMMTINAPSTGLPLVMRADSAGRWFMGESQNFSGSGNTGTAITISPSAGISCYTAGVSVLATCQFPIIQVTPGVSLSNITASSWGNGSMVYCSDCGNTHDNTAVAGAECVGSGSGAVARKQNGHWDCN